MSSTTERYVNVSDLSIAINQKHYNEERLCNMKKLGLNKLFAKWHHSPHYDVKADNNFPIEVVTLLSSSSKHLGFKISTVYNMMG